MIAQLHAKAASRFDTGVSEEANENNLLNSVLFQLVVEIGVSKAALSPVLFDDDIAGSGPEFWMPLSAPGTHGKGHERFGG
jgi:hypothetical protein